MSHSTKKRRSKTVWLWSVLGIVLIALAALLVFVMWDKTENGLPTAGQQTPYVSPTPIASATPQKKLEIDPNAGALITPTPKPTTPGVAIPGWGRMTIPYGEKEISTTMKNPEANEGWYYLTFELRLKETGEVLFTTGLIPPGQYCNRVTLNRLLEPGEYSAIVRVQPYRMADQSPTNNADMETLLVVE